MQSAGMTLWAGKNRGTAWVAALILLLKLFLAPASGWAAKAGAIFPPAPVAPPPVVPTPFDVTGFIQQATLDTTGTYCTPTDPKLAGGTLQVNGLTVIVPCNTILQMPAGTFTWRELFDLKPTDLGIPAGQTGLALTDLVSAPPASPYNGKLPSYEVHVQGNVIDGKYIAGLVFISQQSLNLGQGVINCIDYAGGELHVAGQMGKCAATDTRIRLNDPIGRFGRRHADSNSGDPEALKEPGYDPRFTADTDNPTVHALTGVPMCIPRTDPTTVGDDPLCPQRNRPISAGPNNPLGPDQCKSFDPVYGYPAFAQPAAGQYCRTFVMDPPSGKSCAGVPGSPSCPSDPTQQVPFAVGDAIDWQGTLKLDAGGLPYVSAHTVIGHLGIYTTPGVAPAYVVIDALLVGANGVPMQNLPVEATSRVKVEGMASDPTRLVDVYAMDVDPANGAVSDRLLGSADPGQPPVLGRFRFRPNAGAFLPPSRNYRVVTRTLCGDASFPCQLAGDAPRVANGLVAGQYNAPNFEYVFPENLIPGDPMVSLNLQDLPFLFCGSGPLTTASSASGAPVVGPLNPAPWAAPMPTPDFASSLCPGAPPIGATVTATAGLPGAPVITSVTAPAAVNSRASVTLSATATDANLPALPITFLWTQTSGPRVGVLVSGGTPAGSAVTFTAPAGPATLGFAVTVTNFRNGNPYQSTSRNVTVNVNATQADTVTVDGANWAARTPARGKLSVTAHSSLDPLTTPGLQLFVQASATVNINGVPTLVQLSSQPVPMTLVRDAPGTPAALAVCPPANNPCWSATPAGVLSVPGLGGQFIAPDTITVTSSFGGSSTITAGQIQLR